MDPTPYADILRTEGFQLIGQLDYRLHVSVWWHAAGDRRLQVMVLSVGHSALLKGDKSYYLQSVSADGETWSRDIGLLQEYLEAHFPELRLSFSHFRDVPAALAEAEVRRRMTVAAPSQAIPTVEQIAQLQRQVAGQENDLKSTRSLLELSTDSQDLLTAYAHQQTRSKEQHLDQLRQELTQQRERLEHLHHLQRQYQAKGSAASYIFSISSNLQVARDPQQFRDALRDVVKELIDLHRYQVRQKLGGARLNIQVAEAQEPVLTWIEQWLGGALSPHQLHRLGPEFTLLRQKADAQTMVLPDEDIVVDGHVTHPAKRLAARVVSTILNRLDKSDVRGDKTLMDPASIPPDAMPLRLGNQVDEDGRLLGPAVIPLGTMTHAYLSGITGSGKSYAARVLTEEAARYRNLSILILDPRNQAAGLLVAEDRDTILRLYPDFHMRPRNARGFEFAYYAPAFAWATPLSSDLSSLAHGRAIVSMKGLCDLDRCQLASHVLGAVFEACSVRESARPRLLVVVDEAQLLTRKRVDEGAKDAAAQAERALDRIAREGRKYGLSLVLISQTIKDFAYESASIRQNTSTKFFLRNADREIDYAADFIGDGRQLVHLPTGVALVHSADWGTLRIRARPPYSKVYEFSESEMRRLVCSKENPGLSVSGDAGHLLQLIQVHAGRDGSPLNVTQVSALAGITSKRRLLGLIDELERAGAIRTRRLPGSGRPRVIDCARSSSAPSDETPDQRWT